MSACLCLLLIAFANSFGPAQSDKTLGLNGSSLFDTLIVIFLKKITLKKKIKTTKIKQNYPASKIANLLSKCK